MAVDCCGNCIFHRDGECHRNPPSVFVFQVVKQAIKEITVMKDRAKIEVDYQSYSVFPAMPDHQWCGHHSLKE